MTPARAAERETSGEGERVQKIIFRESKSIFIALMQATVYRVKKIQFNLQVNKYFSTEFAIAKFRENLYLIRNICQIRPLFARS